MVEGNANDSSLNCFQERRPRDQFSMYDMQSGGGMTGQKVHKGVWHNPLQRTRE
jgi:hypothetical protein